jgi:hypothetical protein
MNISQNLAFSYRQIFDFVAFAEGEEEVGFEAVLAGVEVVVAAVELVEGLFGFHALRSGLFDDKKLVGSPDDWGRNFRVAGNSSERRKSHYIFDFADHIVRCKTAVVPSFSVASAF